MDGSASFRKSSPRRTDEPRVGCRSIDDDTPFMSTAVNIERGNGVRGHSARGRPSAKQTNQCRIRRADERYRGQMRAGSGMHARPTRA